MCPIASEKNGRIEDIIAECVGVDKEEILGFDLSLYNRMHGAVLGADGEYFPHRELMIYSVCTVHVVGIFKFRK